MIHRGILYLLAFTFLCLIADGGTHSAYADVRDHIRKAYAAEGKAKTALDLAKAVGGKPADWTAEQQAYDDAVEETETALDDYAREHGTAADKAAADAYDTAKKTADKTFDDTKKKQGVTPEEVHNADLVRDRAIDKAKVKFREKTKATRDKIRDRVKKNDVIPEDMEASFEPGSSMNVANTAGTSASECADLTQEEIDAKIELWNAKLLSAMKLVRQAEDIIVKDQAPINAWNPRMGENNPRLLEMKEKVKADVADRDEFARERDRAIQKLRELRAMTPCPGGQTALPPKPVILHHAGHRVREDDPAYMEGYQAPANTISGSGRDRAKDTNTPPPERPHEQGEEGDSTPDNPYAKPPDVPVPVP